MNYSNKNALKKELIIIGIIILLIMILIPIILKDMKFYFYILFEGITLLAGILLGVIDYYYRKRKWEEDLNV